MRFPARFLNKTAILQNGCWEWTGTMNREYGQYHVSGDTRRKNKIQVPAHRYAYMLTFGEIPEGFHVHHKCENTRCVNPEHLEAVSVKDHMLASPKSRANENLRKTHCPKGHPYDEANTYLFPSRPGKRVCRACAIERAR